MAREGKLPVSLARLTARGAAAGLESGARYLSGLHHPDHLVATALDELIRYANGNFVLVYLLCMAAGWRLLGGVGKGLAG